MNEKEQVNEDIVSFQRTVQVAGWLINREVYRLFRAKGIKGNKELFEQTKILILLSAIMAIPDYQNLLKQAFNWIDNNKQ